MVDQSTLSDPNQHVYDYLEYYCSGSRNFEFAVMLKGPWGSGKTFFMNEFIRRREANVDSKTLYVSLYGLSNTSQIDDLFYRKLHPVLSHKGMKIAASIAKGFVRTAIKVDLDGDNKEDLTLSSQIPDVNFKEFFKNPSNCLLIFDDLERCDIKIEHVLGYINALVEHEGLKAIVVANEDAILAPYKEAEQKVYASIKEKLIGQTIEIKSNVEQALNSFLSSITDDATRKFVQIKREAVVEVHKRSGRNNLRLLKQSLWDFEKIGRSLTEDHWSKTDFVEDMLTAVLALSIEYRSGHFKRENFELLSVDPIVRQIKIQQKEEPSVLDQIEEKYAHYSLAADLFDVKLMLDILDKGWADPKAVLDALNASSHFAASGTLPSWMSAWHGYTQGSDEDFEAAVADVEERFRQRLYVDNAELLHVFGLRLMFSYIGAIDKSKADVVAECKLYIDDLLSAKKIGNKIENPVGFDYSASFFGLGVYERESEEFIDIYKYYQDASEKSYNNAVPRFTENLLDLMRTDTHAFHNELCANSFTESRFYDVPILEKIDVARFVDVVLSLGPRDQLNIFNTLEHRYGQGLRAQIFKAEKAWLQSVVDHLAHIIPNLKSMSKHRMSNFRNKLINTLDETQFLR